MTHNFLTETYKYPSVSNAVCAKRLKMFIKADYDNGAHGITGLRACLLHETKSVAAHALRSVGNGTFIMSQNRCAAI